MRVPLRGAHTTNLNIPSRVSLTKCIRRRTDDERTCGPCGACYTCVLPISWPAYAQEGGGGDDPLSPPRSAIDRFLGPFHGICHPLSPNHVDVYRRVGRTALQGCFKIHPTERERAISLLPATFPPSPSAVIMHVITVAHDCARPCAGFNALRVQRACLCPYICGSTLLSRYVTASLFSSFSLSVSHKNTVFIPVKILLKNSRVPDIFVQNFRKRIF